MAGFYRDPIFCQYIAQNSNNTLIKPVQYVDVMNSCTEDKIIWITPQGVVPPFRNPLQPERDYSLPRIGERDGEERFAH
jgi:hypothetical protein